MKRHIRWSSLLALSVTAGLFMPACNDDAQPNTDEVGDGDGDTTVGDGDGDGDEAEGSEAEAEGDGDGDGDPTTGDGDGDPTTGDGDGDPTTGDGDGDGDPNAVCGNGLIEDGEICDDGNNENNDGCLADCLAEASCGDGFVNEGVEVCDDGVNDGSYGGCAIDCAALGPYCGDGQIDGPEGCDDANADLADGCMDNCVVPASCLTLIDYDDSLENGAYFIKPDGYDGDAFEVWCDMTSDGGGYTFLKVDPGAQHNAAQAETECAAWGMQLWIPRSLDHKNAGWEIANDGNIGPGGSPFYMYILGIYPNFNGATCANQAMNSDNANCGWDASDDGPWYVHAVGNISEPNGDNNTVGSMYYEWQGNGDIQWHNDIAGVGYTSAYYMCDVADKLP